LKYYRYRGVYDTYILDKLITPKGIIDPSKLVLEMGDKAYREFEFNGISVEVNKQFFPGVLRVRALCVVPQDLEYIVLYTEHKDAMDVKAHAEDLKRRTPVDVKTKIEYREVPGSDGWVEVVEVKYVELDGREVRVSELTKRVIKKVIQLLVDFRDGEVVIRGDAPFVMEELVAYGFKYDVEADGWVGEKEKYEMMVEELKKKLGEKLSVSVS